MANMSLTEGLQTVFVYNMVIRMLLNEPEWEVRS